MSLSVKKKMSNQNDNWIVYVFIECDMSFYYIYMYREGLTEGMTFLHIY